jgi:hypothetical protein
MVEHGRTSIPSVSDLLSAIDTDGRVTIMPLDRAVLNRSLTLTIIPEMHDRQIVATALLLAESGENVVLLSRDGTIQRSGLIPVAW